MSSVKLLVLNALIENLVQLLCRNDAPVFFEVYLDCIDQLLRIRRTLEQG